MKNIFSKTFLEFPRRFPIYAVIAALTGFLMLVLPLEHLSTVLVISGVLTVIYAVLRLISVFFNPEGLFASGITVFALIGIILLGFTLALTPEQSAEILATLVGAYLLIDGGVGLVKLLLQRSPIYTAAVYGKSMTRGSVIFLAVLSSLMIAAGILLTSIKISDSRLGEILCGIALIYAAAERIFFAYSENKLKKKNEAANAKDSYIEADFVDKTDSDN